MYAVAKAYWIRMETGRRKRDFLSFKQQESMAEKSLLFSLQQGWVLTLMESELPPSTVTFIQLVVEVGFDSESESPPSTLTFVKKKRTKERLQLYSDQSRILTLISSQNSDEFTKIREEIILWVQELVRKINSCENDFVRRVEITLFSNALNITILP